MRQLKLLGLVIMAIFAVGAITATAALAEDPEILSKVPAKFTTESKEKTTSILETSELLAKITCTNSKTSGEFTTVREGTGKITFKGCKEGKNACESKGAAKEEIVVGTADFTLVDVLLPKEVLGLGLEVLALEGGKNEFKFSCAGEKIKSKVTGSVIGEFLNLVTEKMAKEPLVLTLFTTAELSFVQTQGKQSVTTCDFPAAFCEKGKKKFNLSTNFGLGAEPSGEGTEQVVTPAEKIHIDY
jgi:hypothetical protein